MDFVFLEVSPIAAQPWFFVYYKATQYYCRRSTFKTASTSFNTNFGRSGHIHPMLEGGIPVTVWTDSRTFFESGIKAVFAVEAYFIHDGFYT